VKKNARLRNAIRSGIDLLTATGKAGLLVAALLGSSAAFSQVTTATAPAASPPEQGLEEIVVTAQKTSENLQKASIAVDVVTPNQLASAGINNPYQLQELVPAVKFQAADVTTVSIRGLGTNNVNPGVAPSVAYSVDGIYLSHYQALMPVLFDLQRVEVVLGPQGTLYGRNTNAGVVNFLTNNPAEHFEASVSAQYGNYSQVGTEAMVNIPLSETLAIRAAFASDKHDGYNRDGSNDDDSLAGRVKISYTPSEDLKALVSIEASQRNPIGQNYSYCPPRSNYPPSSYPTCAGVAWSPWSGLQTSQSGSNFNHTSVFGASGEVDANLGWAQLTSLTGFRTYHFNGLITSPNDGNYVPQQGIQYWHSESDYFFTQEVRLASEPSATVRWVTGLYYSDERQPEDTTYYYDFYPALGLPIGVYGYPVVEGHYSSKAIFGDVTYPIVDSFRIRAGLRYTNEINSAEGEAITTFPSISPVPVSSTTTRGVEETNRVTWKIGADYDLTPQNLLYVTASSGFKSGGVNQVPTTSTIPVNYSPETVVAEEVGSKNRFLDDRLQINVSVFHYDYKGYQAYFPFTFNSATFFATVNSQKATFEGGELDARMRITPADTVDLSANFLHDRFNEFLIPSAAVDASGNDVPDAPNFSYGLGYEHVFNLPNSDNLTVGAHSELVAGHYTYYTNPEASYQPTYHRSDAHVTYATAKTGWTITAYIRNIENVAVINTWSGPYPPFGGPGSGQDLADVDPPRTFGLIVKKSF